MNHGESLKVNIELNSVKLQTFAVVHNVALVFFMGDYPASG
jgi:hypothetical protein